MGLLSAIILLIIAIFLAIVIFTVFTGRARWALLTTFSIILVVVLGGLCGYVSNPTFRREFMVCFQPTSQYVDVETNDVLPLPAHTAFDYRYAEHGVVYFTNNSPEEVEAFYQTLQGLTMKEGHSSTPGYSLYKVTYKGKSMTVTVISKGESFGCHFAISSE